MDKFFGTLIAFLGLLMWLTVLVTVTEGEYIGATMIGLVALALSSWAGKMLSRAQAKEDAGSWEEIDDGLMARVIGRNRIEVEAGPEWYHNYEDGPPQKPSGESRQEFKRLKINATGVETEGDALAARTSLWNLHPPCWNCGEPAMTDEAKCLYCEKRLWQKPISLVLRRVSGSSP